MDYDAIYDRLIQKAQNRPTPSGYVEVHHIQPRCVMGSDDPSNLVPLTAEEHYLAHQLLPRMERWSNYSERRKLIAAAYFMAHLRKSRQFVPMRVYGALRRKLAKAHEEYMAILMQMHLDAVTIQKKLHKWDKEQERMMFAGLNRTERNRLARRLKAKKAKARLVAEALRAKKLMQQYAKGRRTKGGKLVKPVTKRSAEQLAANDVISLWRNNAIMLDLKCVESLHDSIWASDRPFRLKQIYKEHQKRYLKLFPPTIRGYPTNDINGIQP